MSSQEAKRVLTRREVADALGLSIVTLDRRIADGSIPVLRLGRRVLIPRAWLDTYIEQAEPRSRCFDGAPGSEAAS